MTQAAAKHGMFIRVDVDPAAAKDVELAKKLDEVCPVNIFNARDHGVEIVNENLDECVLCALCVEAAPSGQVKVVKLYSGETLER
jgi:NAD-dependent dihydropyrimidine dehydrogenase PreA subunit